MKKIISILILLFILTSCSSVGRFGAGVDITFDPRTIGNAD
jgi:predicted small secreted protein